MAVADPVTIDGPTGWAALLQRSVGPFLPGVRDPQRVWRIGPAPELVGQEVADLPTGTLDEAFAEVLASGHKPALVRGTVAGAPPRMALAIAVNGVIAATGPTYPEEGRSAFAVMVDEALFREGANDVRV